MKTYKISGFADEIDNSLVVQLEYLNKFGVDYVELRGVDGKNVTELTVSEAVAAHKIITDAGIKVSAIGSPIGKVSIESDFTEHFELFKKTVDLCGIFETTFIRMFSFFIPAGKNPDDYSGEVIRRLTQMRDYAAEKNVVLLHENEKEICGDTAPRCLKLMNALYSDNFKAIFDFANFVQCGQNTLEAYEQLKPFIEYIHIKDATTSGTVVPVGMGQGNVRLILESLFSDGYDGFLSLEPHLADFAGFAALEHGEKSKQGGDGKFAWQVALNSFKAVLFDIEHTKLK